MRGLESRSLARREKVHDRRERLGLELCPVRLLLFGHRDERGAEEDAANALQPEERHGERRSPRRLGLNGGSRRDGGVSTAGERGRKRLEVVRHRPSLEYRACRRLQA